MSVEQMIIRLEQVSSVLEAVYGNNDESFAPAIELSQEVLLEVIEEMKPLIKVVDLR